MRTHVRLMNPYPIPLAPCHSPELKPGKRIYMLPAYDDPDKRDKKGEFCVGKVGER